jgi:hypothetical protein
MVFDWFLILCRNFSIVEKVDCFQNGFGYEFVLGIREQVRLADEN